MAVQGLAGNLAGAQRAPRLGTEGTEKPNTPPPSPENAGLRQKLEGDLRQATADLDAARVNNNQPAVQEAKTRVGNITAQLLALQRSETVAAANGGVSSFGA
jgi:hypothetical protein